MHSHSSASVSPKTQFAILVFLSFGLSINAGFINAILILGPYHQGVSHITGTLSHFSLKLFARDPETTRLLGVLISFFMGAFIPGYFIAHRRFKLGKRYGLLLMAEALILLVATHLLQSELALGVYLASLACGLQNGLYSLHSKAVVRTTHMTGVVTDLAIICGELARGKKANGEQVTLLSTLFIGFISGGLVGALGYMTEGLFALYGSALGCSVLGSVYWFWRKRGFE